MRYNSSMTPKINSKEIKERATKPPRKKVSLFLSEEIYDDFVKNCEGVTLSVVLEELMKAFNEDAARSLTKAKLPHKR